MRLYQGTFSEFPDYAHEDHGKMRMLYDDSMILTFNHAKDSSKAVMNAHYDDSEAQEKYLSQFDSPKLSAEQLDAMTEEELKKHEQEVESLDKYKKEIKKALDEFDHYEHGMRVIDTDYDNYLFLYHCIEDYPEVVENETS